MFESLYYSPSMIAQRNIKPKGLNHICQMTDTYGLQTPNCQTNFSFILTLLWQIIILTLQWQMYTLDRGG